MGAHVSFLLLVERLQNTKKKQGKCCLMIDYKSVYNGINRERLYRIPKNKDILTNNEVDFLQAMHDTV